MGPKRKDARGMTAGVAIFCLYLSNRKEEDGVSTTTIADKGTERGEDVRKKAET